MAFLPADPVPILVGPTCLVAKKTGAGALRVVSMGGVKLSVRELCTLGIRHQYEGIQVGI